MICLSSAFFHSAKSCRFLFSLPPVKPLDSLITLSRSRLLSLEYLKSLLKASVSKYTDPSLS